MRPQEFARALYLWREPKTEPADPVFLCVAESKVIGVSHVDAGTDLLRFWGLPEPVIEAVAGHATTAPPTAVTDASSAVVLAHLAVEAELGAVCGPAGFGPLDESQFDEQVGAMIIRWRRERSSRRR